MSWAFTWAPFSSSTFAAADASLYVAQCSDVQPSLSLAFSSAPCVSRDRTSTGRFRLTATNRSVAPSYIPLGSGLRPTSATNACSCRSNAACSRRCFSNAACSRRCFSNAACSCRCFSNAACSRRCSAACSTYITPPPKTATAPKTASHLNRVLFGLSSGGASCSTRLTLVSSTTTSSAAAPSIASRHAPTRCGRSPSSTDSAQSTADKNAALARPAHRCDTGTSGSRRTLSVASSGTCPVNAR